MADIRITPASSVMAFTSSLNFKQTLTQDASGSIVLQGSGSINRTNLFAVDGNNGRLFSIDDDLSDSLFSVNTIAGLPVIEAFANNTVIIGQYGQNVLVVTGSRVGIGTITPNAKLDVSGSAIITGSLNVTQGITGSLFGTASWAVSASFVNASTTNAFIQNGNSFGTLALLGTNDNQSLAIETSGSTRMFISSSGFVGIGTTSPSEKLDVSGNIRTTNNFIADNSSLASLSLKISGTETGRLDNFNSALRLINFHASSATTIQGNGDINVNSVGSNVITLGTSNTERMRITSAGNVNIGGNYTSTTNTLQVTGNAAIGYTNAAPTNGLLVAGNVGIGTTDPAAKLMIEGDYANMDGTVSYSTNTKGIILNQNGVGGDGMGLWFRQAGLTAGIGSTRVNSGDWATDLRFYTHPSEITNQNTLYERMRINSEGNVGIGAFGSGYKLDVNGNTNVNGNAIITGSLTTTAATYVGGNLSVGTTYNGFAANIAGTVYVIGGNTYVNDGYGHVNASAGTTGFFPYSNKNVEIKSNGVTAIFVTGSNQNVGIGTTSPRSRFHINSPTDTGYPTLGSQKGSFYLAGDNNLYGLMAGIDTSSGTFWMQAMRNDIPTAYNILLNPVGGNVGIGKTVPSAKLDVSGSAIISGSFTVTPGTIREFQVNTTGVDIGNLITDRHTVTGSLNVSGSITGSLLGTSSWALNALTSSFLASTTNAFVQNGNSFGTTALLGTNDNQSLALETSGSTRMFISSSGNVGIGTTSPASLLNISATTLPVLTLTRQDNSSTAAAAINFSATSTVKWQISTSNSVGDGLEFNTANGSGNVMYITRAGNVGIGTTVNSTALHIARAAATAPIVRLQTTDSTSNGQIQWANSGNNVFAFIGSNSNVSDGSGNLEFATGGTTTRMMISSSGNVGIGTTSPASLLEIKAADPNLTINQTTGTNNSGIKFQSGGNPIGTITAQGANGNMNINMGPSAGWGGYITLQTDTSERIRITSAGNVGIGQSSIQGKLHVYQTTNLGGTAGNSLILQTLQNTGGSGGNLVYIKDYAVRDATGTSWTTWRHHNSIDIDGSHDTPGTNTLTFWERDPYAGFHYFGHQATNTMTIDGANGRVGIGTLSPSAKFQVVGGSDTWTGIALRDGGTNNGIIDFRASDNTTRGSIQINGVNGAGGDRLGLYAWVTGTGLNEVMSIKGGGNVGIGTIAPSEKLTISGSVNINSEGSYMGVDAQATPRLGFVKLSGASPFLAFAQSSFDLRVSSGTTISTSNTFSPVLTVKTTGEVGIGTTLPSFPLSFGTGLGNKIALYDAGVGTGYGFGIQSSLLQIFTHAATDDITFGYGNSASLTRNVTFKGGGNVGIGTTLPDSKLTVGLRASTDGNIRLSAAGTGLNAGASLLWDMNVGGGNAISHLAEIRPESYATGANKNILNFYVGDWNNNATSGTAKMTIAQDGNVGIGTISPLSKLDVYINDNTYATAFTLRNTNAGSQALSQIILETASNTSGVFAIRQFNGGGAVELANYANAPMTFWTSGSERMRIAANGNVGIGTTDPGSYKLYVSGTIYATGDVIAFSDESVKENIRPIENVIEKIQSTRGIIYDRIDTETKDNIGFIAQELEVAFPELVVTNEDGTKAVKYQNTVAVLFEAIKEQQKQIDAILKVLDNGVTK